MNWRDSMYYFLGAASAHFTIGIVGNAPFRLASFVEAALMGAIAIIAFGTRALTVAFALLAEPDAAGGRGVSKEPDSDRNDNERHSRLVNEASWDVANAMNNMPPGHIPAEVEIAISRLTDAVRYLLTGCAS